MIIGWGREWGVEGRRKLLLFYAQYHEERRKCCLFNLILWCHAEEAMIQGKLQNLTVIIFTSLESYVQQSNIIKLCSKFFSQHAAAADYYIVVVISTDN